MEGRSVVAFGFEVFLVVEAGMFDLLEGLPPRVRLARALLLLIVLSLVRRAVVLIRGVLEVGLLLHVGPSVALDVSLKASVNKIDISLALDTEIGILVKLRRLEPAH